MKLVIDDACYAYREIFAPFGDITALPGHNINKTSIKDADVLIVRSRTKVNQDLLQGSKVKFVGSTVAGLDHLDQTYLKANNITFFSAQGCNSTAVAEFVISGIVNLAHTLDFDYTKKTLAIIGVGNIGSRLQAKAKLLGIQTLLNDPPRQQYEDLAEFVDLDTALSSDIITFHTPLSFNGKYPSYQLLNAKNFHHITAETIIFNTARGGIIAEDVWQKTPTKANIIDCWENEPNINQTLQKNAYWATPHIAGHSIDAKFMGSFMVYKALCKFVNIRPDEAIANLINPATLPLNHNNLLDSLNAIYDFKKDTLAIADSKNFEYYRRHYPIRYQWHHFNSCFPLPL